MHRTIGYLSRRFTQIRPGEERKVLLTFSFFFLVITAYYVIKPASRSLILGELGSRMVPYADLICAFLMGPIVTLFARLVDRMPKTRLVSVSFWAVIGVLLIFWKLLDWPVPWIAGAFYIWVAIFSVLVVTLFWLVANDIYRPREAKRLFGFIGAGGILGGMVGSSIAAMGAQIIGTTNLLLASAVLLGLAWLIVQQLWGGAPERYATDGETLAAPHRDTFLSDVKGFLRLLTRLRYFVLLMVLVGVNKIIATLIYYQLNPFIERTFTTADAKTTFIGLFFGTMNGISFVVQCFLTSWILRRFGILTALLVLPMGLLAGAGALLIWPLLWVAAVTELYDGSLNYSLQQTTKEVLYLPIDRAIRYKVKPFIDMVVFRFGKGIAAILGIVLLDGLGFPPQFLSYIVLPLVVGWLFVAVWLRRDYVTMIRVVVQARASKMKPAEVSRPALSDDALGMRKLSLVEEFVGLSGASVPYARELLQEAKAYQAKPDGTMAQLAQKADQRAIRRQIAQEVATYQQLLRVAAAYRHYQREQGKGPDAIGSLLRVLAEESVERTFQLLTLLYRPEDIQLVYAQMREPDIHVRADAVELLDNLIDPELRGVLFPMLDEDRFLAAFEAPSERIHEPDAQQALQQAIWDRDAWLGVATLCVVGQLRLASLREDVEKAVHHPAPLVATAARMALHLCTRT